MKKNYNSMLIAVWLVLFVFIIILASCKDNRNYEETTLTITIRENDTLWRIAEKYKNDSQDIREYIDLVKDLNNMKDSIIYEGQEIQIIKYKEVD